MLVQPIAAYAFTTVMVQRSHLEAADVSSLLLTSLGIAGALSLAIGGAGLLLRDRLPEGLGPLVAALALVLPFNAVEGVANGLLLRRQHFRGLALRGIAAHIGALGAGLSLAVAGGGAWAVVGQQLTFFGTAALLAAWFARLAPPRTMNGSTLREVWGFAMATVANGMAERAGFRLFLIAVAGGQPALAGVLQIAFRIVEVARDLPTPFMHRYGLPALSRLRADPPAMVRRLSALCFCSGLAFGPVFTGLAFCAAEVQQVLLGPGWGDIIVAVQVLALALALVAFYLPMVTAFAAVGRPVINLWLTLGGIALPLLLAPLAGTSGTAAGVWSVTLVATAAVTSLLASKYLRFRLADQARLGTLALLPAFAVGAVILAAEVAGLVPTGPVAALMAKVAIGGVAGAATMFLLGRQAWREVAAPVPDPAEGLSRS
jgi:PST family polysaccharide transporter